MISKRTIEKKINIIWLGGPLRPPHVERAKEWVKLNPGYDIIYYVDEQFKEDIKKQLGNLEINLKDISSINLSPNQQSFIKKLIEPRHDNLLPNYAAASDLYRFTIEGWYADTDVTPFDANKKVKENQFSLVIHATRDGSNLGKLTPDVFAISASNVLSKIALQYYEFLSEMANDEHIQLIRSNKASVRKLATEFSTGIGLRYGLGKLVANGKSIIEVLNEFEGTTHNEAVFDAIAQEFDSAMEQSYILSSSVEIGDDQRRITSLCGIDLDSDYLQMTGGIMPNSTLQTIRPISALRRVLFKKIETKTLVTQEDSTSSQLLALETFGVFSKNNLVSSVTPQIEMQILQMS